jgi:hypothetical protein
MEQLVGDSLWMMHGGLGSMTFSCIRCNVAVLVLTGAWS